jgi:subtilisin-like proprotein convertase family protein
MKRKNIIFVAVLVALASFSGVVFAQEVQNVYNSTDTPKQLQEGGTAASTLVITDSGIITDLKISLDITHESVDQLEAYLIGPDGTRVKLFAGVGAGGSNFSGTWFIDWGGIPIKEGQAPFTGSYLPEGNIADFHFKEVEGTWTLEVKDSTPGISGTLDAWKLATRTLSSNMYFEDTFPSTIISSFWMKIDGATVDDMGINNPSGPYSLRLNGDPSGGDSITSREINLSGCLGATLVYSYERFGPGPGKDSPETGEDLVIEYNAGDGWIELDRQLGDGPDMRSFQQVTVPLPSEALCRNVNLQIRRSPGTVGHYDDWFVDNVKIVLNNPERPGIVDNPSFEGQTWGWTTTQAFSSSLWQSDGSYSARVFTIPEMTLEAGAWVGLAQSIDLSNIVAIKFDAGTTASSGGTWEKCVVSVCIDDAEVWSDTGADKTWLDVQIDTAQYTGIHTLSLRLSFLETGNFNEDVHFDNIRTYLAD